MFVRNVGRKRGWMPRYRRRMNEWRSKRKRIRRRKRKKRSGCGNWSFWKKTGRKNKSLYKFVVMSSVSFISSVQFPVN